MRLMSVHLRQWLVGVAIAMVVFVVVARFAYWYLFVDLATCLAWTVELPGGGKLEFDVRSQRQSLVFAPSDYWSSLRWTTRAGRTHDLFDGRHSAADASTRLRKDGKAMWLVSPRGKLIVAALDLETEEMWVSHFPSPGSFPTQGITYDPNRDRIEGREQVPNWATLEGGTELPPSSRYDAP